MKIGNDTVCRGEVGACAWICPCRDKCQHYLQTPPLWDTLYVIPWGVGRVGINPACFLPAPKHNKEIDKLTRRLNPAKSKRVKGFFTRFPLFEPRNLSAEALMALTLEDVINNYGVYMYSWGNYSRLHRERGYHEVTG